MKKENIILCCFTAFIISGFSIFAIVTEKNNPRNWKYYGRAGIVTKLGQCDRTSCAVKFRDSNGDTRVLVSYTPMVIGQKIIEICQDEKRTRCVWR